MSLEQLNKKMRLLQKQLATSRLYGKINIFSLYNTNQQLVLPIDLEIMIPETDSVRLLNTVLEGLDYSELYNAYSTNGRNPAISPKTLFMVLVYANLNDIHS